MGFVPRRTVPLPQLVTRLPFLQVTGHLNSQLSNR